MGSLAPAPEMRQLAIFSDCVARSKSDYRWSWTAVMASTPSAGFTAAGLRLGSLPLASRQRLLRMAWARPWRSRSRPLKREAVTLTRSLRRGSLVCCSII